MDLNQSQSQSPHQHLHQHQQHQQTMSQQPSPSPSHQQQHHDATPQDVLAEARKNLQALIDSGLSKDLLHQWVDESQLSMTMAAIPSIPSMTPIHCQPQQNTFMSQQPAHPTHSNNASLAPPPPMRCPPPPPIMSNIPTVTASASTTPSADIKPEALPEDVSGTSPQSDP